MRAVRFDTEFVEQRKSLPRDEMARSVVDVDSVLGRLYPVVVVFHLR